MKRKNLLVLPLPDFEPETEWVIYHRGQIFQILANLKE